MLTLSLIVSGPLSAQDVDDQTIRQTVQDVLDAPQYRYFEHLDDDAAGASGQRSGTRWPSLKDLAESQQEEGSGKGGAGSQQPGKTASPSKNHSPANESSDSSEAGPPLRPPSASDGVPRPSRRHHGASRQESNWDWDDAPSESSNSQSRSSLTSSLAQGVSLFAQGIAWLVIALICGLILFLVIRSGWTWNRRTRQAQPALAGQSIVLTDDRSPGELAADAYLAEALKLAQQGAYGDATARLLWGGMSHIERSGWIRYRRGLTLRDYLRSVRGRSPQFESFRQLVQAYEPVGFGRRPATGMTFEAALQAYRSGFLAANPGPAGELA